MSETVFSNFYSLHLPPIYFFFTATTVAAVSGSIPGTWRDGGAKSQSLVSVLNIPGLNPKSCRSEYDVKEYVPLITIRPSDEDVTPCSPLGAF